MYPTDYRNWAPRVSFAYSPRPKSNWLQKAFGNGKTSIRAGFGMTYYHFGEELLNTFDHNGAFGLSTVLSNPASVQTEDCAPRVTSLNVIPVNGWRADFPAGAQGHFSGHSAVLPRHRRVRHRLGLGQHDEDALRLPVEFHGRA